MQNSAKVLPRSTLFWGGHHITDACCAPFCLGSLRQRFTAFAPAKRSWLKQYSQAK